MKARYIAALIALCLLVGIVAIPALMTEATGVPGGIPAPTSEPTIAPLTDGTPAPGPSETDGTSPAEMSVDTDIAENLTPTVTPTEYMEQDSTPMALVSIPATSVWTPVPTPTIDTVTPTPTQTELATEPTTSEPTTRAATEKATQAQTKPEKVTVHIRAQDGEFSPSSVTVPPGAEVTIVFENRDAGVYHKPIIYPEGDEENPIFEGASVKGIDEATDTFTAPSAPGTWVLGDGVLVCGIPAIHAKGTFTVE